MMMQVQSKRQRTSSILQSILLRITGTCAFILRWGDIEAVTQGELDAAGVVVLHLTIHHPIAVKQDMVDAAIKEIISCQFDIETVQEEVFTDTKREHWISAINPNV